ncbi:hypothetical protein A4G99_21825 [Haladaptatus sp. R4]|uniref:glycosyltransferase family 39 protein n=1 Tax=Haladaptatus sp. R4 TaxID=1679489 RepID=UPI0007B4E698|nr:glycosyltransferase family 39 protein [Haladaptatus sp. R4]KZN26257.1 hypothetical protein A4G99_21825 [Haladaptatus sp. R4]
MTLLAFIFRLFAIPVSLFGLNTYSKHDAVGFRITAHRIADGRIPLTHIDLTNVYHYWGSMLSLFYWLPGPSDVYSHLFVAAIGCLPVWFVYEIATELYDRRAAVYATLPIAVFPTFLLVQTSLIREGPVLLLITAIVYLFVVPTDASRGDPRYLIMLCFVLVTLFRPENLFVYAFAIFIAWGIKIYSYIETYYDVGVSFKHERLASALFGSLSTGIALIAGQKILSFAIAPRRAKRARGGSAYLVGIIPSDLFTAAWFAPIGIAYFLFSPFPWMVKSWTYLAPMAVGILNLGLFIAGLVGAKTLIKARPQVAIPLIAAFALLTLFYGLMEGNVGAAIRHRQMVIWVMYLCAGVGLAERFGVDVSVRDMHIRLVRRAKHEISKPIAVQSN